MAVELLLELELDPLLTAELEFVEAALVCRTVEFADVPEMAEVCADELSCWAAVWPDDSVELDVGTLPTPEVDPAVSWVVPEEPAPAPAPDDDPIVLLEAVEDADDA